jgi:hypothetical protein
MGWHFELQRSPIESCSYYDFEFFNRIGQNLPFEVTIQIALNPTVNGMAVWVIAQTHIKQLFNTKSAALNSKRS